MEAESVAARPDLPERNGRLSRPRILLLGLSAVSLIICAAGACLHYVKWAWGNPAHPAGWLLAMFLFLAAFAPPPRQIVEHLKRLVNLRTAFFVFWFLVFVISHLWNFRTAPWNGDALFDESGWDLWFLKHHVIGQPYQPAWYHIAIARETLFHYYLWPFFKLFGFNILSYEAGLFFIWAATFIFTILLVDLFFGSKVVTSATALIFNFLPFAFIYTFAGYRYPMATALCVTSLYFIHLGFKTASRFYLALGGITAGLCLASSISGKQYLLALLIFALLYVTFHWRKVNWRAAAVIAFGWLAGATPLLCYIVFNRKDYTFYESNFIHAFLEGVRGNSHPNLAEYAYAVWECFFRIPGPRFFIPDTLPIPLPYYCFLLPGLVLACWQKRYEIPLLAIIPVAGAFVAGCFENRLLLPIPFWIILMGFTFAGVMKLRFGARILLGGISAVIAAWGLAPSIKYIYAKSRDSDSIRYYAQGEVAVSRFLKDVVAGKTPANPPHLERNEFNRVKGSPDLPFDTLICQTDAYSILHLFLHDYDDVKILSFCNDLPFAFMPPQDIWSANKRAISAYVPGGRDLKLVWQRDPKTEGIIKMFEPLRDIGREETISFVFGGRQKTFYVLNIQFRNIPQFKERVGRLPDALP